MYPASRASAFASVGQASARIIVSLPWTLFTSLLTHRLVQYLYIYQANSLDHVTWAKYNSKDPL